MSESSEALTQIFSKISEFLPLIIPILLIQWGLIVFALIKIFKSTLPPKYLPKWVWILIILFVNLVGPILYLIIGRNEE